MRRGAVATCVVEGGEGLATVHRLGDREPCHVNRVRVLRVHAQLAEIHRPRVAIALELPGPTTVVRAEDATLGRIERRRHLRSGRSRGRIATASTAKAATTEAAAGATVVARVVLRAATTTGATGSSCVGGSFHIGRTASTGGNRRTTLASFDLRVHDVCVAAGDLNSDAAVGSRGHPRAVHLVPALAAVIGAPECAASAAAIEAASTTPTLIARREQHIAVRRIHGDVGEAGVFVDVLDLGPGLAAVGGLVDAAIGVRSKQMARRRHVHDLRIARINHDTRDRLHLLQPHIREGLAAVGRLVDTVAERRCLTIVRLTGPDVDNVRVGRMDRDVADAGH